MMQTLQPKQFDLFTNPVTESGYSNVGGHWYSVSPEGDILPEISELYKMPIESLELFITHHEPKHRAYLAYAVELGYATKVKWHVESMLKGDDSDYTYYPVGVAGEAYMQANKHRDDVLHAASLLWRRKCSELRRKYGVPAPGEEVAE